MTRSWQAAVSALALAGALGAQQPNGFDASLIINGGVGPPFPIDPVIVLSGLSSTLTFGGSAGAPITLGQSPNLAAGFAATSLGSVDLDLTGATVLLNGQRSLGPSGALVLTVAAPQSLSAGLSMSYQAAILSPAAPAGAALTAATRITTVTGIVGANVSPGDDNFVQVSLTPYALTAAFYDTSYSSFFINSNGSLSFQSGAFGFLANSTLFLSQMPRIAPFWNDLSPNVNGIVGWQIDFTQSFPLLTVRFVNVPSGFGAGGSFTTFANLQLTPMGMTPPVGDIQIINPTNNLASPYDTIVGVSPGSNFSLQTTQLDLSALQAAGGHIGGPMDAIWEFFRGTTSTTGLPGSVWDLTGTTLTFLAIGAGAPGAFYTML